MKKVIGQIDPSDVITVNQVNPNYIHAFKSREGTLWKACNINKDKIIWASMDRCINFRNLIQYDDIQAAIEAIIYSNFGTVYEFQSSEEFFKWSIKECTS